MGNLDTETDRHTKKMPCEGNDRDTNQEMPKVNTKSLGAETEVCQRLSQPSDTRISDFQTTISCEDIQFGVPSMAPWKLVWHPSHKGSNSTYLLAMPLRDSPGSSFTSSVWMAFANSANGLVETAKRALSSCKTSCPCESCFFPALLTPKHPQNPTSQIGNKTFLEVLQ